MSATMQGSTLSAVTGAEIKTTSTQKLKKKKKKKSNYMVVNNRQTEDVRKAILMNDC